MVTMIWLKIALAAVLSGSMFALVEIVLPPRPAQSFTIQVSDWPGDQIFALIEPLGIPLDHSVRLDIRRAAPSRDPVEAFRAGLADAVLIELARLPSLITEDVRVIYAFDEVAGGGGLIAAPGLVGSSNLAGSGGRLRGRKVGVTFGNAADPLVFALLDRAGVGARDVTLVRLVPEAAEAALREGRVAAVAALSPSENTQLLGIPGTSALASTKDLAGLVTHVMVVRESQILEQRDRINAVLRATDAVVRTCRPAMERCLELMAAASGRPAVAWRQDFEALRLLDITANRSLMSGGKESPLARRLIQNQPQFRTHAQTQDLIDPSLIEGMGRP
ncbi:MAG: ABC transporter substrate-binding protein [Rhodospirillaceae bacterium]